MYMFNKRQYEEMRDMREYESRAYGKISELERELRKKAIDTTDDDQSVCKR